MYMAWLADLSQLRAGESSGSSGREEGFQRWTTIELEKFKCGATHFTASAVIV